VSICSNFFGQLHQTCEKHKAALGGKYPSASGDHGEQKVKKKIIDPLKSDPNAPKKPIIQGYLLYYTDVRSQRQKDHPTKPNTDLTRIIAEEWNKLTKEKRTPYEEKAKANRESYETELQKYLDKNPEMKAKLSNKKKRKRPSTAAASSQAKPEISNGKAKAVSSDESSDDDSGDSSGDDSSSGSSDDESDEDTKKKIKK